MSFFLLCLIFFFFKQKTAYEMRISDWSSDVCSSDLMSKGPFRAALVAILALALFFGWRAWQDWQRGYDPETVVAASLQGLQEQNVLVPFTARYVAVVTSTQSRLGLSAKKTLIMPGTVRY